MSVPDHCLISPFGQDTYFIKDDSFRFVTMGKDVFCNFNRSWVASLIKLRAKFLHGPILYCNP